MGRIVLWFATTATALVLLLSYPTSQPSTSTASSAAAPDTTAEAGTTTTTTAPDGTTETTYVGSVVDTRYGPIQVSITVANGRISTATAPVVPSGEGRTNQISASAVPTLNDAAVAAQSANIDTVSGATFTSEGYKTSLQSALDQANL